MRSRFSVSFCLSGFEVVAMRLPGVAATRLGWVLSVNPGLAPRAQFKAAAKRLDQRRFLQLALPILNLCLSHRSPLDALHVIRPLEDAVHVNAGRVHLVGIDLARLHQMLDFGNRYSSRGRHHGIEVPRRLPVHELPQRSPFHALMSAKSAVSARSST